jgi:hypothetical protein
MSARDAQTPGEDDLLDNELTETPDLEEESKFLQEINEDAGVFQSNELDNMDQDDSNFDNKQGIKRQRIEDHSYDAQIEREDEEVEGDEVEEEVNEEVELVTATYDPPKNRADQQPNILRRTTERQIQQQQTQPERQIQTRRQVLSQRQQPISYSKAQSSSNYASQNTNNSSQLSRNTQNQVKKEVRKKPEQEHYEEDDYDLEDDDFDERKGCRSLICDPNGIIISETVYRCMICSFISDSISQSKSHYYKKHMKENERPKQEQNGRRRKDPEPLEEVPSGEDELEEEPSDETEDEDYFVDEDPETSPQRPLNRAGQASTPSPYSRNPNVQQRRPMTESSNSEKKPAGNFVLSPSPAGYVPARNAQKALAAQQNASSQIRGGYVTCAVCNITKYYASVQRRYGQFTCMGCAKFFGRFLINPRRYVCPHLGSCPLDISPRCKACLLHACINTYVIDAERQSIVDRNRPVKRSANINLPSSQSSSSNTLLTTTTTSQQSNSTTPSNSAVPIIKLSSTSGIVSSAGGAGKPIIIYTQRTQPLQKAVTQILPKTVQQPQIVQQPQTQPAQPKLQPIHSYQTRPHTRPSTSPSTSSTLSIGKSPSTFTSSPAATTPIKRGFGCKNCSNCLADDCGKCMYCRDKPKYGGPNTLKKRCIKRRCLINPAKR